MQIVTGELSARCHCGHDIRFAVVFAVGNASAGTTASSRQKTCPECGREYRAVFSLTDMAHEAEAKGEVCPVHSAKVTA